MRLRTPCSEQSTSVNDAMRLDEESVISQRRARCTTRTGRTLPIDCMRQSAPRREDISLRRASHTRWVGGPRRRTVRSTLAALASRSARVQQRRTGQEHSRPSAGIQAARRLTKAVRRLPTVVSDLDGCSLQGSLTTVDRRWARGRRRQT